MLPIKLDRVLIEKIWGGRNLEGLDITLPSEKNYGESWEVAARGNCITKVSKDVIKNLYSRDELELITYKREYLKLLDYDLQELLETFKEKLVGEDIYKNSGNKFPLLIKYLDINDKLSIQVHPDDSYAVKNENDLGKTECWYIMDASGDAELILGLNKGVTKEDFIEKTKKNDFGGLFNKVKVKKGDFLFITPGVIHASLRGSILICEVQQNSDTTYRIYDFDRLENGKKRELNLEKAYEVIDYSYFYNETKAYLKESEKGLWEKTKFIQCPYFNVEYLKIFKECEKEIYKNFIILSFLEGHGELFISEDSFLTVKKGDTYFIPANFSYKLKGEMEVLKSFIETE